MCSRRHEYEKDIAAASDDHAVIIIDYSQNLTLPSVSSTPSQWYFLSLWSVSMFGVYFANTGIQHNYLYEEMTAGKGSNEVISLLHLFVRNQLLRDGYRRLTIYADNCSGQNKNNHVVKFLLALTHVANLEEVNFKFFVKGHTKSAVDRGFGHVRKRVSKEDIWTMERLVTAVAGASSSSVAVHVTPEMDAFKNYKLVVGDAYKNVPKIRQYQIFSMKDSEPGRVTCRVGPDTDCVEHDLRRGYDGILINGAKVQTMLQFHLEPLPPLKANPEKVDTMHNKVKPYVPAQFADDRLYAAPSEKQVRESKLAKQERNKNSSAQSKGATRTRESDREAIVAGSGEHEVAPAEDTQRAEEVSRTKKKARKAV